MKWFEGSIPQAIQAAKNNKAVFIVFISGGDDETSTEMESYLHQENITTLCETNKCVAVKLASDSNDCKFFSQIFPVVVIPSTFFIGDDGTPLEVIGECKSSQDFLGKVKKAISLQNDSTSGHSSGNQQKEDSSPQQQPQTSHTMAHSSKAEWEKHTNVSEGAVGGASTSDEEEDDASPEKKAKTEEVGREERVERAKQLIREKQDRKALEEREETKRKEAERRKVGQGVQKLRENQKEMDMLEAKKELKKDKEEDKLARQRVKEQISRDRAEKNARFSEAKQEREKAVEEARRKKLMEEQATAAARQAQKSDTSRIQFRLPDGTSLTQQFAATDTFNSVREFIAGHAGYSMTLSTSFPRRTFTDNDDNSTLRDLSLAPSAVIMVIPGTRTRSAGSSGGVVGLTNVLFAPFYFLWNIIASLFGFGSLSSSTSESSSPSPPSSAKGGDRNTGGARQRDSGAIHRFRNAEDDEDDKDRTTWNGNSTQQM